MRLGGHNSTTILPGRGLINPAFVIKIVPATDDLQQKNRNHQKNPNSNYLSNLIIGDSITFKRGEHEIRATINRIIKNSLGDVAYVIGIDDMGKSYKIEASRIQYRRRRRDESPDREISTPGIFNENKKFLSFSEFIRNEISNY